MVALQSVCNKLKRWIKLLATLNVVTVLHLCDLFVFLTFLSIIGCSEHLVEYETERQRHVVATTAGIDGLYRLYSNNWTPVVLARSLGLMTVNALTPLKVY